MGKSLIIAKNFILQLSKSKANLIVYIILPPFLAVLFMIMLSTNSSSVISVGIRDLDKTNSSQQIISHIEESDKYNVTNYSKDTILDDVANKKIRASIVIPEGFENSLINGEAIEVELYSLEGAAVLGWLEGFLEQKISGIAKIAKSDNYQQILKEYKNKYVTLNIYKIEDSSNKSDVSQSGFGMYLFASVFSIWGICALAYKEKIFKTYQRIITTPITHFQYAFGNILVCLFFAIIHMLISFPLIFIVFNMKSILPVGSVIVLMISLYICVITLGTLLVSLSRSQSSVAAINILILTITSMLGGCYWSINFMPQFMQDIAKATPQYWFNSGIISLSKGESIITNIIVLLSFSIIYLVIYIINSKSKRNKL